MEGFPEQKRIVVTGASSGIGAAASQVLARRGHRVVLVARRDDALRAVAAECGPHATTVVANMTKREDVRGVVATLLAHGHPIDCWINNVGRGIFRLPSELTDDDIDEMIRVNVKTALYGMQEILPHFKARGSGHIINISSMLGRIPLATFRSAYNGAKHFLGALTANFRSEIQETHPGIQISLLSPGVVYTDFGNNARHGGPDSRQIPNGQDVGEVAQVLADLVERPRPDVYTRAGSRDRVLAYFSQVGVDP